jgi:hypothetical protein
LRQQVLVKLAVAHGVTAAWRGFLMSKKSIAYPFWSTTCYDDSSETSPMELSALGEHLTVCKGAHSRLFSLQCAAETMHGFVVTRFVTTLVIVALLIGISFLVF